MEDAGELEPAVRWSNWFEIGASTQVLSDSKGRVAYNGDADNTNTAIAYRVSTTAANTARIWIGTAAAPSDLLPFIQSQRNLSGRIRTIGGDPRSVALTTTLPVASVSNTPGAPTLPEPPP